MGLFGRSHWSSATDTGIKRQEVTPQVEKQVEVLRQRSQAAAKGAAAQQAADLRQPDSVRQLQEGQQPQHATASGGVSDAGAGAGSGDTDGVQQQDSGMHRYAQQRPAELEAPPADDEEYREYRALGDLREPYRIPREYMAGAKEWLGAEVPEAPLLVFINSRSGGRAGARLAEVLCHAVGHSQVYDLQDHRPGTVLRRIYENLDAAVAAGDAKADYYRAHLRILAAGGDGTVAWILGTVAELCLDPPPNVAVLPLGTGNDLSLTFGWGNTFLPAWLRDFASVYHLLRRIADAQPRDLDCWHVDITAERKEYFQALPYSLQPARKQPASGYKVAGYFWNYMSVGMDAKAAHGFHSLREQHPWAASTRLANQAWYAFYGFRSGWMFGAPPICDTVKLQVRQPGAAELEDVHIPKDVKALVILNLQSYAGGRDLFGLATDPAKLQKRGFQVPIFNDGLFEVVGLKGGWHTGVVMSGATRWHAVRLAQVPELRISMRGRGARRGTSHMQLDGEPWRQDIPTTASSDQPFEVHIRHAATSHMLVNSERLRGIRLKVQRLAAREAAVSAVITPSKALQNAALTAASSSKQSAQAVASADGLRQQQTSDQPTGQQQARQSALPQHVTSFEGPPLEDN